MQRHALSYMNSHISWNSDSTVKCYVFLLWGLGWRTFGVTPLLFRNLLDIGLLKDAKEFSFYLLPFMVHTVPQGTTLYSQHNAIESYPKPTESNPYPHVLFLFEIHFNSIFHLHHFPSSSVSTTALTYEVF